MLRNTRKWTSTFCFLLWNPHKVWNNMCLRRDADGGQNRFYKMHQYFQMTSASKYALINKIWRDTVVSAIAANPSRAGFVEGIVYIFVWRNVYHIYVCVNVIIYSYMNKHFISFLEWQEFSRTISFFLRSCDILALWSAAGMALILV